MHTAPDACASCHHEAINPLGFGFENYDAVGAWRTTENGVTIDATGTLAGTAAKTAVHQRDHANRRRSRRRPRRAAATPRPGCATRSGAATGAGDACAIQVLGGNLGDDDYKVTDLMVDITRTRAFMFRAPGGN